MSQGQMGPRDGAALSFEAYRDAIAAIRVIVDGSGPGESHACRLLVRAVGRMAALIREDNQSLLALALRSTPVNYLHAHCVNLAILSLRIGQGLELDIESLMRLGVAGILADVGMKRWLGLALQKRRLTPGELASIKDLAEESVKVLDLLAEIEPPSREVIGSIIVRLHSRGRAPLDPGRSAHFIKDGADILSLCQAYEALSHPRSWREPILPHEAVKAVLKLPRDKYNADFIKLFAGQLTIYPPGSYVKLVSGEIGRVVRVNPESPSCPIVRVFLNAEGRRLRMPWFIDLKQQPLMHIERAVDEAGLETEDSDLQAMFKADRWWV